MRLNGPEVHAPNSSHDAQVTDITFLQGLVQVRHWVGVAGNVNLTCRIIDIICIVAVAVLIVMVYLFATNTSHEYIIQ